MAISSAQKKLIRSLDQKKYRDRYGLFVVEGVKSVSEFLKYQEPEILLTDIEDIRQVSFLKTPQPMLAVFRKAPLPPKGGDANLPALTLPLGGGGAGSLILCLDAVQDPGNLGTIIRLADWFGINTIVCSPDTADAYNPKTVQATMGSLARTSVIYVDDLAQWLSRQPDDIPVYGTFLDGEDIYTQPLQDKGFIVMGNEGKGISDAVSSVVTHRLHIPSFSEGDCAESLNVAIATAITCSEFRRRDSLSTIR